MLPTLNVGLNLICLGGMGCMGHDFMSNSFLILAGPRGYVRLSKCGICDNIEQFIIFFTQVTAISQQLSILWFS